MKNPWHYPKRKCECCGKKRLVAVSSSVLGAVSTASCRLCAALYAEPLFLVETVIDINNRDCADWVFELWTFKDGQYYQVKDLFEKGPDEYWENRKAARKVCYGNN